MNFLDRLNRQVAQKRKSTKALAKVLDQSATRTESEFLHGINITRFTEMHKHDGKNFDKQISLRVAWQDASSEQRNEIMSAIHSEQH